MPLTAPFPGFVRPWAIVRIRGPEYYIEIYKYRCVPVSASNKQVLKSRTDKRIPNTTYVINIKNT